MTYAGSQKRPLLIGEVLADRFPDGTEVVGGAPLNVAWHLAGFGLEPVLISRVGRDLRGERILHALSSRGVEISGVQIDEDRPTGFVDVSLSPQGPRFEITKRQAWDFLDAGPASAAVRDTKPALVYYGTLAARTATARHAIVAAIDALGDSMRFMDVNLRAPWWNRGVVDELVRRATHIKLNLDELEQLWPPGASDARDTSSEEHASRLRRLLDVRMLIVTRGEHGAVLAAEQTLAAVPPARVVDSGEADTVGAGDAFSAVVIAGLLRKWAMPRTLARALEFASAICSIRGAVPESGALYDETRERWRVEDDG